MSIKDDVAHIVGRDCVVDDDTTLSTYSCDQSFVAPRRPDLVAFAQSVEQVQEVVKYANTTRTPIIPFSSGLNLHGGTIPRQGGIVLNLSRMNNILMVDEENWFAVIEPGVTYAQLQNELEKHQLRFMPPFGVAPKRSVLTSSIERDPALAAASFEYGNDLMMDTEIILPYGDLFRTGLWSSGGRPGSHMGPVRSMVYRFWSGAQGTLGIVTKLCVKVEYLPVMRKLFFVSFDSFNEAIEPLKAIQHKELGLECFLLNHFNVAALLCEEWIAPEAFPATRMASNQFSALKSDVPPWMLVICLSGGPRMPEGKVAYEEEVLHDICSQMKLQHYNGMEKLFYDELLRPWGILKKFCYRGTVQDLSFKSPLRRVPEFQMIIHQMAHKYDYPAEDIGVYILPIERGRAVHCEFDFHCDRSNPCENERIKQLWLEASEALIDEGAYFDQPYGAWAPMMYSRAGTYTQKLKELKKELDPNNILNPGHLCF